MDKAEAQKLATAAQETLDKLNKIIKASDPTTSPNSPLPDDNIKKDDFNLMMREVHAMVSYCHQRINNTENDLYNHTSKGHLPPIEGAGKMNDVLAKLGMADDYEAHKKSIQAAKGVFVIG